MELLKKTEMQIYLSEVRSHCHNAKCVFLVIYSKSQPGDDDDGDDDDDDDLIGSKHIGV